MAHFAKIYEENQVLSVQVVSNKTILDENGEESESLGQTYLEKTHGWPTHLWIQTSYNTKANTHSSGDISKALRGNYAGIGYEWDDVNQIFWQPQPYPSWVKNVSSAGWISPSGAEPTLTVEQESQNNALTNFWFYEWNESTKVWDLIDGKP